MACDFCAPSNVTGGYRPLAYCGTCDLFCLAELAAPCLQAVLEDPAIRVRVWLEVLMQTPHSSSMGVLLAGRQPRAEHRGRFAAIPNPTPPTTPQRGGGARYQPTTADIHRVYQPYAREAADIADQQVAQLRGHQGRQLVPLPVGARARIGFGTRGERMDAAVQAAYVSPMGIRYELTWFHIGTIVAARIHCYPDAGGGLQG